MHALVPGPAGDVCATMTCEYGSTCTVLEDGLPRCSCRLDCTNVPQSPVCASDLKMYPSECLMNREGCQRQVELRLRPLELCEGSLPAVTAHPSPVTRHLTTNPA